MLSSYYLPDTVLKAQQILPRLILNNTVIKVYSPHVAGEILADLTRAKELEESGVSTIRLPAL